MLLGVDDFLGPDLSTGEDTAMLVLQGIVHMLGGATSALHTSSFNPPRWTPAKPSPHAHRIRR